MGDSIANRMHQLEAEVERYQQIAAEQGTTILRLRLALRIARQFGLHSREYHALIAGDLADWIDAGADTPIPYPSSPTFARWADGEGIANVGGHVGYRMVGRIINEEDRDTTDGREHTV